MVFDGWGVDVASNLLTKGFESGVVGISCFFYGSYMDPAILRKYGANPGPMRPGRLKGWRLTFTPHANLVPDEGGEVEGVIMYLSQDDVDTLYGPQGFVTTYHPVDV